MARGIKLTFHFGEKILNLNEDVFKEDDRKTYDLIVLLQFKFKHIWISSVRIGVKTESTTQSI